MSNFLSVATVTAALSDIIQPGAQDAAPGATVTIGPPRQVPPGVAEVNLYLYRVDADSAAHPQRPALALQLHYLVSFSGEDRLAAEIMLGKVAASLAANPVLSSEIFRQASRDSKRPYLNQSDLDQQTELVRLVPEYLSLEELAKLWSMFFQIAHRPSLQYVAAPILIDVGPSAPPSSP
jgi:hypothetical protein